MAQGLTLCLSSAGIWSELSPNWRPRRRLLRTKTDQHSKITHTQATVTFSRRAPLSCALTLSFHFTAVCCLVNFRHRRTHTHIRLLSPFTFHLSTSHHLAHHLPHPRSQSQAHSILSAPRLLFLLHHRPSSPPSSLPLEPSRLSTRGRARIACSTPHILGNAGLRIVLGSYSLTSLTLRSP